jgi:hypothetical protein
MGKVGERVHVWVLFGEESPEKSPKNLLGGESSSGEMIKLTIPHNAPNLILVAKSIFTLGI